MEHLAMKAIAVAVLMAVFWITEAVSIFATSFIPVVLFPLLGVLDENQIGECLYF
jgi:sodium-dependent dicarboxylate transporter 2/3/5